MKKIFLALVGLFSAFSICANDQILLEVENEQISVEEFEYMMNKNNSIQTIERKSVDEYLEMFENYMLKVVEAKSLGIDTLSSIQKELHSYYERFSAPYLCDSVRQKAIYKEVFDHLGEKVDVSHILIRINSADTTFAYTKAKDILDLIEKGNDFNALADKYSEDPSVKNNHGNLGYIMALQTVYPFEKAAYSTPIGKCSLIRTSFGYHIVKVNDRQKTFGKILISNIYKPFGPGENRGKQSIDSVYQRLLNGENAEFLIQTESKEPRIETSKGELGWFHEGEILRDLNTMLVNMVKEGKTFSEPVTSPNGWHILIIKERKANLDYEDELPYIEKRLKNMNDERFRAGQDAYLASIKAEYKLKFYPENLNPFFNASVQSSGVVDSTFEANLKINDAIVFTFADRKYTQQDFLTYLRRHKVSKISDPKARIYSKCTEFANKEILNYEIEKGLRVKNRDYDMLMREFEGATLCYEVSRNEVWDKANSDVEGLKKFYAKNKKNYTWSSPRFKGFLIQCKNDSVANLIKKDLNKQSIDSVMHLVKVINKESRLAIVNWMTVAEGENKLVDALVFGKGKVEPKSGYTIVFTEGKLYKKPQDYTDVRGPLTADYQEYLDKQWVEKLRKKYTIKVNSDVLESFKKSHE